MQDFNLFYFWLYRFRWNIVAFLLCYECSIGHLLTPFMGQFKRHPFIVFESFYFILSSFFLSEWLLLALTCCFVCKFSVEQGNTTGNHNTYIVWMKFCWNVPNDTGRNISERERRAWFSAEVVEFIAIFLLNAFTLATYIRNRHLRKGSTYLIINLTVADLLVAIVARTSIIFEEGNLETLKGLKQDLSLQSFLYFTLHVLFSVASLANISLISLERLHATLFPYRHCLVGTRVYLATILCSWLFSLTFSSVLSLLTFRASLASFLYVITSYIFLSLLILTVSYSIIISTVKNNPHTPNAGTALSKERKLTVTLFTVTVVFFLTILPWAIFTFVPQRIWSKLCPAVISRIHYSFDFIYFFNSIVNPLIYAVRMQEFRKAARKLFCTKTSELARVQPMEPLTLYVRTQAIPVEERT